eukprot:TRINITY_DN8196_c0_g1_i1.p3 TRINITY_DN8196_c0_g1~~TRINITY_DN8196_c0_g1_i1.p3  ORF type:complete len:427 (-),score=127.37 TRINITY_DN8196_c0_g1_i1:29-1189(-)
MAAFHELRLAARKFAQKELPLLAAELEATRHPVPAHWKKKYAEHGFLGINVAEKYGGLGLPNGAALAVLEEFAKVSSAVAFPVFESCVGPAKVLERFAQPALAAEVLQGVCRGERVVAVCMSEPDAGSALTDLTTRAHEEGESIVVSGQKRWTSGAGFSDMVVYARMGPQAGAKGIGAVFVPLGTAGVSFGAPEALLGFRGIPSADIFFDNARVPKQNVLVPAGGFARLMESFDLERCGNATMALAQAQASLDDVVAYVQQRKQFGRALVEFQAVQLRIAEMHMKVAAARALVESAVAGSDSAGGLPSVLDSSTAKCMANEVAVEVCQAAVQLMGGYGLSEQYPLERRLRDALCWRVAGGAVDIQKINIASAIVGRRFPQRSSGSS